MIRNSNYHPAETICPYCESTNILYSDSKIIHLVRKAFRAKKRYCVECKKKWRIKSRYGPKLAREFALACFVGAIGFSIFYGISIFQNQVSPPVPEAQESSFVEGVALQAITQGGGSFMNSAENLSNYSPNLLSQIGQSSGVSQGEIQSLSRKYKAMDPTTQRKVSQKAKNYINQYKSASPKDRERLIREARKKMAQFN